MANYYSVGQEKLSWRNRVWRCGVNSSGSGQRLVTGPFEHYNETSGSIKTVILVSSWATVVLRNLKQGLKLSITEIEWTSRSCIFRRLYTLLALLGQKYEYVTQQVGCMRMITSIKL
jgi:hypothetical protein